MVMKSKVAIESPLRNTRVIHDGKGSKYLHRIIGSIEYLILCARIIYAPAALAKKPDTRLPVPQVEVSIDL